jgi:hypothetical protein
MLIELRTGRDEQQSYRADTNTIDQESFSAKIRHHITTRTRLSIGFDRVQSDFFGYGRSDETRGFGLGLDYRASTWVFVTSELGYSSRQSTDTARDYDRLMFTLGLGLGRPAN